MYQQISPYCTKSINPYYACWLQIKHRCFNSNSPKWHRYGGRGITVYEPWQTDFKLFVGYLMENLGPRPVKHSLDRIDNDGNYEPGNLRWATQKQQVRNRKYKKING